MYALVQASTSSHILRLLWQDTAGVSVNRLKKTHMIRKLTNVVVVAIVLVVVAARETKLQVDH